MGCCYCKELPDRLVDLGGYFTEYSVATVPTTTGDSVATGAPLESRVATSVPPLEEYTGETTATESTGATGHTSLAASVDKGESAGAASKVDVDKVKAFETLTSESSTDAKVLPRVYTTVAPVSKSTADPLQYTGAEAVESTSAPY